MSEIFFTSDLHIGHHNIIRMCDRPFKDALEMDNSLINNWNSVVGPRDTVYMLGDMFWRVDIIPSLLPKLNGRITFLRGNHDKKQPWNRMKKICPEHTYIDSPYLEIDAMSKLFVLCHYPLLSWNHAYHGSIHLHGHTHNSELLLDHPRRINVCVEHTNYTPIHIDTVLEMIKEKENDSIN